MTAEGPHSGPRKWLSVPYTQTMIFDEVKAVPAHLFCIDASDILPLKMSKLSFKKKISVGQIRHIARRIGRRFHPQKIILFGSYAYGHPAPDSDVDLFIIMQSKRHPFERAVEISKLLDPRPFPVDILVRTPAEIERRLSLGDPFIQEILSRGKVLYGS